MPEAATVSSLPAAVPIAAQPFICSSEAGWSAAWVHPAGELDLASSPEMSRALNDALLQARLLVLDLRELTFIDSAGIHAILDAGQAARRRGGQLMVVRGPAPIDRVLTLARAAEKLAIFDLDSAESAPALGKVA